MCVYWYMAVVFCDMGTVGKMISSHCRMTIMSPVIGKISQGPLSSQVAGENIRIPWQQVTCAVHRISSEPIPSLIYWPKPHTHGWLKNEDMLYRRALLVLPGIYCIAEFEGEFSGWDWNRYWGRWGGLGKDAICARDDVCYHGDFMRGPFYIFSRADFPFRTF